MADRTCRKCGAQLLLARLQNLELVEFDLHEVGHGERFCLRTMILSGQPQEVMVKAHDEWSGMGFQRHDCAPAPRR